MQVMSVEAEGAGDSVGVVDSMGRPLLFKKTASSLEPMDISYPPEVNEDLSWVTKEPLNPFKSKRFLNPHAGGILLSVAVSAAALGVHDVVQSVPEVNARFLVGESGNTERWQEEGLLASVLNYAPVPDYCSMSQEELERLGDLRKVTFLYLWSRNPKLDKNPSSVTKKQPYGIWSDDTPKGKKTTQRWTGRAVPDTNPDVVDPSTELFSGIDEDYLSYLESNFVKDGFTDVFVSFWVPGDRSDEGFKKWIEYLERIKSPLKTAAYVEVDGYKSEKDLADQFNPPTKDEIDQMSSEELLELFKNRMNTQPRPDPSVLEIRAYLDYIVKTYGDNPNYSKIDGKYVVGVYSSDDEWFNHFAGRWIKAAQGLNVYLDMRTYDKGLYKLGQEPLKVIGDAVFPGQFQQPDHLHVYSTPNRLSIEGRSASLSVGMWPYQEGSQEMLSRDPFDFARALRQAMLLAASGAIDELYVTTANEMGENSGFLPQTQVIFKDGGFIPDPKGLPSGIFNDILKMFLPKIEYDENGNPREKWGNVWAGSYCNVRPTIAQEASKPQEAERENE